MTDLRETATTDPRTVDGSRRSTSAPEPVSRRRFRHRRLIALVGRRLVALILLLFGISMVSFVLTNLVPADPVRANLGFSAGSNPEAVEQYRARYGLDEPLPQQYASYLGRLLRGDMGESIRTGNPVRTDLARFIPATVELGVVSLAFGIPLGVALGTIAALYRNRVADHALRVVSLVGISMPTFWLALVSLYLFFGRLGWFPGGGRLPPGHAPPPKVTGFYTIDALLAGDWSTFATALHHLVLPGAVLAAFSVALLTRFTRSAVLEVVEKDYVRAARAKGLRESTVVIRHILRAALVSVVTVIGLLFANVLTGAILIEYMFGYPGLGQYAFQAATGLDLPAIMGISMFVALVYVTINFVVDLLYGVIDPRVRVS